MRVHPARTPVSVREILSSDVSWCQVIMILAIPRAIGLVHIYTCLQKSRTRCFFPLSTKR